MDCPNRSFGRADSMLFRGCLSATIDQADSNCFPTVYQHEMPRRLRDLKTGSTMPGPCPATRDQGSSGQQGVGCTDILETGSILHCFSTASSGDDRPVFLVFFLVLSAPRNQPPYHCPYHCTERYGPAPESAPFSGVFSGVLTGEPSRRFHRTIRP